MRRRTRNALVVLTLVYMTGTISIWVISYFRHITFFLAARAGTTDVGMYCYRGSISLNTIENSTRSHGVRFSLYRYDTAVAHRWDLDVQQRSIMGFALTRSNIAYLPGPKIPHLKRELLLPIWFAFGMSIFPLLAIRRLTRTIQRAAVGRCTQCGYDLRATPDRCPECGAVPTLQRE